MSGLFSQRPLRGLIRRGLRQLRHHCFQLPVQLGKLSGQSLLGGGVLLQKLLQKVLNVCDGQAVLPGFFYISGQKGVLMAGDALHILADADIRLLPLGFQLRGPGFQLLLQGHI